MSDEPWALPNHIFTKLVVDIFTIAKNRARSPLLQSELALRLRQDIKPVARASLEDKAQMAETMPLSALLSEAEVMMAITPVLNRCSVGRYKTLDECRAARRMAENIKEAIRKRYSYKERAE